MQCGFVLSEVIKVPSGIAVGATFGQSVVAPVLDVLRGKPREQTLVFVDFSVVEATNTSFVKAVFLELLWWGERYADSEDSFRVARDSANVYPMLLGLSDDVRDEVVTALGSEGLVGLETQRTRSDVIVRGRVLGRLEDSLKITLDALTKEGTSTAPTLCERYPAKKQIQPTAWNNRLVDLYRYRLVTRERAGRQWTYQALTKEVVHG